MTGITWALIIPILLIGEANLLGTFLRLLLVEKRLALDGNFFFQLIVAELLISIEDDFGDERLFSDDK